MKAEFTIFQEGAGYWYVQKSDQAAAISEPAVYRGKVFPTKIAACRTALSEAEAGGAKELHLYGFGATTGIKKEAKARGIKPFIYFPSIDTKLA
ncbi:hypothetical protein K6V72_03155 [Ralstonia insidiosa]|uniref:Uncharacterized protein n=1 Tax=Ralstonia insidiosa TaxID=190721 RepID=A0A191ZUP8_9RALS|nr:hypothetical protein [Ralstonia insidiosa]ANJ71818.1 hypothetical protein A9Y76_04740 [Ralstonia insidiosa]KAB0472432.1 hypothetical protein F7R11_07615 [Ralstonia insidiosa]MBY4907978.1 hypothetical protein [Ralstonia insidiosa]